MSIADFFNISGNIITRWRSSGAPTIPRERLQKAQVRTTEEEKNSAEKICCKTHGLERAENGVQH